MNQSIKNKIYFWTVCAILASAIVSCQFGCASVDVISQDIEFHSITVLKDIKVDPNDGIISTTSPKTESIITGIVGLLVGWLM
jgi:hypothetical protein